MAGAARDKAADRLQQMAGGVADARGTFSDLVQRSPALLAVLGLRASWQLAQGLTVMERASQMGECAAAVAEQTRAQLQQISADALQRA
jgi:ABC-type transporter Mla subunit MlaD